MGEASPVRKMPLSEQVIVVTGASTGVGRAVARAAGRRGASVVCAARSVEALDTAVREIEGQGAEALAVPFDAASQDECNVVVERAVDRFGRIDSFVRCHMVAVFGEIEKLTADELRRVMDVNFIGSVYCYWAVLPHLRESRGTFVDVNSALAYRGIPLQAAYCASKAALRTFFESARVELEKEGAGVDICVTLPGAIDTPHFDRARQKLGLQPQPVPPIYEPEPFAEVVLHCCEHPHRELPIGWGAQKALWAQKVAPRLVDHALRRTGWSSQTTGEPKPIDSPDNLFETVPGDPGARGRFGAEARSRTIWTTLRLHPRLATVLALLGIGMPAAVARVAQHNGHPVRLRRAARIG
jgi:NAD(P)-dependent dehydrogenase (short-subunit alcohol dehydrogenase family)